MMQLERISKLFCSRVSAHRSIIRFLFSWKSPQTTTNVSGADENPANSISRNENFLLIVLEELVKTLSILLTRRSWWHWEIQKKCNSEVFCEIQKNWGRIEFLSRKANNKDMNVCDMRLRSHKSLDLSGSDFLDLSWFIDRDQGKLDSCKLNSNHWSCFGTRTEPNFHWIFDN